VGWAEEDENYMSLALQEAARGRGAVEPNPMVGAVIVHDGQVVGVGHHERFGGPHAEVMALRGAGDSVRGATLYVTLEPCCHFGKTPPCTDAILAAGIARVVTAIEDLFPAVDGGGHAKLRAGGLVVEVGCGAHAARGLNAAYLKRLMTGKPLVTAKWAMTLDGKTAVATGDSRWISSEASRAEVHKLRGTMDGIVVGIGTALSDDPLLTVRPPGPRTPMRIVIDSQARLPIDSQLVRTAREVPVLVAVGGGAPRSRRDELAGYGCQILPFDGEASVPISRLVEELGRRGMTNVLVEGGGRILGSFFDADEIDAVEVYVAALIEGGDHPRSAVRGRGRDLMNHALRLRENEVSQVGGDVRIKGWIDTPWRERAGFSP
jgi:diaminohydroxyphosphoribosylaminopyrimidine deaminase / 5-amino-6-(5-phosphoribosylamino)uracil reductase